MRFAYYNLEQRIAKKRKTQNGRRALFGLLRDRALLHIFTLGPRAETIASMRLEDVDWENNRIRLRELKGQREDTAEGIWKDVHPKLIADIREFVEYLGVTNSHGHTPYDQLSPETYGADDPGSAYRNHTRPKALPLWVRGRIYFDEKTGEHVPASGEGAANLTLVGRGLEARPDPTFPKPTSLSMHIAIILKPYTGGIAKSGHTLRHLAEQLAQAGARDHLNTHDEPAHFTEAAIAAALLDHTMPGGISAIYADLESQRGRLARIAAYAITEYIAGERGARLGLDEERIIASRRQYQEAQAELIAAQARIAELELDLATIGTRKHPLYTRIASLREQRRTKRAKALTDGQSRSDQEYRRLDQELKQLDDELDELRDELAALQGRLAADFSDEARIERGATARLHRVEEALREATEARIPLPPGQEPQDLDKRLQQLLRGTDLLEDDDVKDQEPELVRDRLTVKEYAIVMGIVHPTMRRYIRIALASEDGFPFSGGASNHRNPWFQPIEEILEVHGPRMRRFSFDALDLSRYTPGQIAAMKHLLSTMPAAGE